MKRKLKLDKKKFYPVSKPFISKRDIKKVNKILKDGWISSDGPEVKEFESKFAKYVGRKYSISGSSGTAALDDENTIIAMTLAF